MAPRSSIETIHRPVQAIGAVASECLVRAALVSTDSTTLLTGSAQCRVIIVVVELILDRDPIFPPCGIGFLTVESIQR